MMEIPLREASGTASSMQNPITIHRQNFAECDRVFAKRWDAFVSRAEFGHLHQSYANALLRSHMGWEPIFLWIEAGGEITAGALLLRKPFLAGLFSIMTIPSGPWWLPGCRDLIPYLLEAIAEDCVKFRAIFCRYNLPCPADLFHELRRFLTAKQDVLRYTWSYWNLPRVIALLNITGKLDDVISRMHKKMRRTYRRSQEFEVRVFEGGREHIPLAVELLRKTAKRKQLLLRDETYFNSLFDVYPPGQIVLVIGEVDQEIAAFNLAVCFGDTTSVLYGTLDYNKRHFFPSEAVEIGTIKWAQEHHCVNYDLGGICTAWPPQKENKGYGVWHYKKRLGAQAVLLGPYCDIVFSTTLHRVAWVVENSVLPFLLEKGWGRFKVMYERLVGPIQQ